ncbi:hypothetical protein HDU96_000733 [Phlyctochytrium bullatum]|nr:hypothetical protein HDU96_000733 [Phlyctochytrium bullatum]
MRGGRSQSRGRGRSVGREEGTTEEEVPPVPVVPEQWLHAPPPEEEEEEAPRRRRRSRSLAAAVFGGSRSRSRGRRGEAVEVGAAVEVEVPPPVPEVPERFARREVEVEENARPRRRGSLGVAAWRRRRWSASRRGRSRSSSGGRSAGRRSRSLAAAVFGRGGRSRSRGRSAAGAGDGEVEAEAVPPVPEVPERFVPRGAGEVEVPEAPSPTPGMFSVARVDDSASSKRRSGSVRGSLYGGSGKDDTLVRGGKRVSASLLSWVSSSATVPDDASMRANSGGSLRTLTPAGSMASSLARSAGSTRSGAPSEREAGMASASSGGEALVVLAEDDEHGVVEERTLVDPEVLLAEAGWRVSCSLDVAAILQAAVEAVVVGEGASVPASPAMSAVSSVGSLTSTGVWWTKGPVPGRGAVTAERIERARNLRTSILRVSMTSAVRGGGEAIPGELVRTWFAALQALEEEAGVGVGTAGAGVKGEDEEEASAEALLAYMEALTVAGEEEGEDDDDGRVDSVQSAKGWFHSQFSRM